MAAIGWNHLTFDGHTKSQFTTRMCVDRSTIPTLSQACISLALKICQDVHMKLTSMAIGYSQIFNIVCQKTEEALLHVCKPHEQCHL